MNKLIFIFSVIFFSISNAQPQTIQDSSLWPTTPDTGLVVACGSSADLISDGDGGAIISLNAGSGVKVKRINKWGHQQWNGWSGVNVGGTGILQVYSLSQSSIAEEGNGGVLKSFEDIFWEDPINGDIWANIRVQKVDHDGNRLWGDGVRVTNITDTIYQTFSQVQSDGRGGCIVCWLDTRNATGFNYDLYIQRIDLLGNLCWGDSAIRISPSPNVDASSPILLIVDENENTFLRWENRIQKLDINGNKLWGDFGFIVNNMPKRIGKPYKNKGYIISGSIYDYNLGYYFLQCQRVDSSGYFLWDSLGVMLADSIYSPMEKGVSGIEIDSDHNIFVSYYHEKSGILNTYIQKINPDGIKLLGQDGIVIGDSSIAKGGYILLSGNNIYALTTTDSSYYSQRFDSVGNTIWNEDLEIAPYYSFIPDGYGGVITLGRGGPQYCFALSRFSKNGIIGEILDPANIIYNQRNTYPQEFLLKQNYPNPFNNSTTIEYKIPKRSKIIIKIHNILGEEVIKFQKKHKQAGTYKIHWDGRNRHGLHVSSGIYLYQLKSEEFVQNRKLVYLK